MPTHPATNNPPRSTLERWTTALHHDFCPSANRWVYWLKNPLWCLGATTLSALICGVFVNPAVLVLSGVLLAVIGLGVAWPRLVLYGISCEIDFERPRVRAGQPVGVELLIRNRWPWPVWGLHLHQGFVHSTGDSAAGVALECVGGWKSSRFTWRFQPARRGVYPLETPRLETSFPFGLSRCSIPAVAVSSLIVWPDAVSLNSLPDAAEVSQRENRLHERLCGDLGDVLGTRGFRPGDSLRRIHWPQSARHQRLIVCERQAPAACSLRVHLDVERAVHAPSGGETLERLIRVAASLCESLHAQHALVDMTVGDEQFRLGAAALDLRRALDALARIPVGGLDLREQVGATSPRSGGSLSWSLLLTTEAGAARRLQSPHAPTRQRVVLCGHGERPDSGGEPALVCGCRPWLEIDTQTDLAIELPRRWRRACHAG